MSAHQIETFHNSGMSFKTNFDGNEVIMDANAKVGGQGLGPSPKHLLLNALAGCTGMDVVSLLKKMRVEYSDFSIEIIGHLTEEHPIAYHTIEMIYKVKTTEQYHAKFEKAVNLSQDRYCGISAMLGKAAKLTKDIVYL